MVAAMRFDIFERCLVCAIDVTCPGLNSLAGPEQ
jgi:hypothetical protein